MHKKCKSWDQMAKSYSIESTRAKRKMRRPIEAIYEISCSILYQRILSFVDSAILILQKHPPQAVEYLLDENHRLSSENSIYIERRGEVDRLSNTIADLHYKLANLNSKLAEHSNLVEEKSWLRRSIIQEDALIAQLPADLQRLQQASQSQRFAPLPRQQGYWEAPGMQNQATFEQQRGVWWENLIADADDELDVALQAQYQINAIRCESLSYFYLFTTSYLKSATIIASTDKNS
ncbi:uncharacterized protein MYCFIDRAFT_84571 [Pseudocercospora fijiensis CIRAD86]|uniref:Uncharacterized protein n=1 Tax=Pseudocercospora fijiensis (strain CIRAD86) TaxID=383855 RepID=M3BB41_PSEFD|nr:uncharacterized protein MYCFIDRAFT_84571 [Pseudocercospora fijiensis CIRAD86]EME86433.1 hypothetical protein MYCFIDRAFT_84571 [Pseudocercospora fijiensis CIRAD86]